MSSDLDMVAEWPDGRHVGWLSGAGLIGDPQIVAAAQLWLAQQIDGVMVTPTGPLVPADVLDALAVFIAIETVAPGAEWSNAPSLVFDAPDEAIF